MIPSNEFVVDVCGKMSSVLDQFQTERLRNVLLYFSDIWNVRRMIHEEIIRRRSLTRRYKGGIQDG